MRIGYNPYVYSNQCFGADPKKTAVAAGTKLCLDNIKGRITTRVLSNETAKLDIEANNFKIIRKF